MACAMQIMDVATFPEIPRKQLEGVTFVRYGQWLKAPFARKNLRAFTMVS